MRRALTSTSEGLGLEKGAVSAAFDRAAQEGLDALNGRALADWAFAAIYTDGISFAELVRGLLENPQECGLEATKQALFGIDGSKAPRTAIAR